METKVRNHGEILREFLEKNKIKQNEVCRELNIMPPNFASLLMRPAIKDKYKERLKEVYNLDLDDPAAPVSTIFERSAPHGGIGGDDCEQKKEALKKELAEKNQVIELQNITIQSLQLNIQLLKEKLSIK